MKEHLLKPTILLLSFCIIPLFGPFGGKKGYDKVMDDLAKDIAKKVPYKSSLVVYNFENQNGSATLLSAEMAGDFCAALHTYSHGRFSIKEREKGEEFFHKEMKYTIKDVTGEELKRQLESFRVDFGVIGKYELTSSSKLILGPIKVISSLEGGNIIAVSGRKEIELKEEKYKNFREKERRVITSISDTYFDFLEKRGDWENIEKVEIYHFDIEKRQEELLSSQNLEVNKFYSLRINLKDTLCYLYVFGWDRTNDMVGMLFPDNPNTSPLITKDDVRIPTDKDMAIKAIRPTGYNWVKLIVSKTHISFPPPSMKDGFFTEQDLESCNKTLSEFPKDKWGSEILELWIEE